MSRVIKPITPPPHVTGATKEETMQILNKILSGTQYHHMPKQARSPEILISNLPVYWQLNMCQLQLQHKLRNIRLPLLP